MRNLGEDILLLALEQNGTIAARDKMHFALAGSELARLAALRRIGLAKGRIVVIDPTATGDFFLDRAFGEILASRRPPRTRGWINSRRDTLTQEYLSAMAASGLVRCETRRRLGVFQVQRWFVADFARADEVMTRLHTIALSSGPIDAAQAAFGGLLHAVGLDARLYPRHAGRPARKRLKSLAQSNEIAYLVAEVVRARQARAAAVTSAISAG